MRKVVLGTGGTPPAERFDYWRDAVERGFAPMVITSERTQGFHAEQRLLPLGDAQVMAAAVSPSQALRSPRLIRRSDPETLGILITLTGTLRGEAGGRTQVCGPGDVFVHDSSHPFRTGFAGPGPAAPYTGISVIVPRSALPLAPDRVAGTVGLRLPRGTGLGGLLLSFLHDVTSVPPADADAPRLAPAAGHLVSAMLAHATEPVRTLPRETRAAVLALRVRRFAELHLADPGLGPQMLAAAHHISVRYVHRLFRAQGTTPARWIREERLERARRELAAPGPADVPVARIAERWGFRGPAEFSRAFRAAYGVAPRDYREALR